MPESRKSAVAGPETSLENQELRGQASANASAEPETANISSDIHTATKSDKDDNPAGEVRSRRRASPDELRRSVYEFSDLSGYSAKERFGIRFLDLVFYLLIKGISRSVRWEVLCGDQAIDLIHAAGHRAVFTFWHTCIFSATWFWRRRGIVVMSSLSRDGEFVGRFIKRFGYGTSRGSSTRGSGRALALMAQCLESGLDVAFTIDGPKGPALVAKEGAVILARHTGQAILPFHITPKRCLSLRSWDRQQIPLPFTRVAVLIGEPIYVPHGASGEEVNRCQRLLQSTLERLYHDGEAWRETKGSQSRTFPSNGA